MDHLLVLLLSLASEVTAGDAVRVEVQFGLQVGLVLLLLLVRHSLGPTSGPGLVVVGRRGGDEVQIFPEQK